MAATHSIPKKRVHEVIEMTGPGRSGQEEGRSGFSLGMGQRLGIAAALLGDPQTVILDEPVNGLDPEGVVWVRNLAKYLASEGRTVFLSSHLMSEMAVTADHLIVIGRGRIIADAPIQEIITGKGQSRTRVRTDQPDQLHARCWPGRASRWRSRSDELLEVTGPGPAPDCPRRAGRHVMIYELTPLQASLEEAYMELTKDEVEYHSLITTGAAAPVQSGGN